MHLSIPIAIVKDPVNIYANAYVDIDSQDDEIAYIAVRNRQGTNLVYYSGPFENLPDGSWLVHTETGDVLVERDNIGCGCGGTSITPRGETADG